MPWILRKIKNKNLYSVKNAKTGAFRSKATTLKKAKSQLRLLESLGH
jgi:hypothetical protein